MQKLHVLKIPETFSGWIASRGKCLVEFLEKFVRWIFFYTFELLVSFQEAFLSFNVEFGTTMLPKFFKLCFLYFMILRMFHKNLVYFQQLFTELEEFYQHMTR